MVYLTWTLKTFYAKGDNLKVIFYLNYDNYVKNQVYKILVFYAEKNIKLKAEYQLLENSDASDRKVQSGEIKLLSFPLFILLQIIYF